MKAVLFLVLGVCIGAWTMSKQKDSTIKFLEELLENTQAYFTSQGGKE